MNDIVSVDIGRQISVSLQNEQGALANMTGQLSEAGINVYALTLTGGIDHGYVRMVVDQHEAAMKVLDEAGELAFDNEVVLLEIANRSGGLARVARTWSDEGISIEYGYCASGPHVPQGLVVVCVDQPGQAVTSLRRLLQ